MEQKINLGKASAVRILVAEELGLNPEYVPLANEYIVGKLFPLQYGMLEKGGIQAVELINNAGLTDKASELAQRYFY